MKMAIVGVMWHPAGWPEANGYSESYFTIAYVINTIGGYLTTDMTSMKISWPVKRRKRNVLMVFGVPISIEILYSVMQRNTMKIKYSGYNLVKKQYKYFNGVSKC